MNRESFNQALTQYAQDKGFWGEVAGNLKLLEKEQGHKISLEQILRIQIMMGDSPQRVKFTLELGADPQDEKNGISLYDLVNAYTHYYSRKHHKELIELLEQYGASLKSKKSNTHPLGG